MKILIWRMMHPEMRTDRLHHFRRFAKAKIHRGHASVGHVGARTLMPEKASTRPVGYGASSTARQAGGRSAMVSGGRGFSRLGWGTSSGEQPGRLFSQPGP